MIYIKTSSPQTTNMEMCIQIDNYFFQQVVKLLVEHQIPFAYNPLIMEKTMKSKGSESYQNSLDKTITFANEKEFYIGNLIDNIIETGKLPSLEEIASQQGMSVSNFKYRFNKQFGKTFYRVCLEKKMEYAAKLLKKGYKANEVYKMIGYGEKSAIKFSKMFQKYYGVTPKKYQLNHCRQVENI